MDMNEFEGKWELIRAQSKIWWSLITDSDINKVAKADIKFFGYVTLLQSKYGFDRQAAKDEVGRRVAEFEAIFEKPNAKSPQFFIFGSRLGPTCTA